MDSSKTNRLSSLRAAQEAMERRRTEIENGDRPAAEPLLRGQKIRDLESEIQQLRRQCRELEREVNDYRRREQDLLAEIEEMNERLRFSPAPSPSKAVGVTQESMFKEAAQSPAEIPEGWEPFMYAYTDYVFVEYDEPDLLLYWNGAYYTNPKGTVVLRPPITQKTFAQYNILKVRPLTTEELDEISERYNLK